MDAFIGEIRPFGFNFAPSGWIACKGQVLAIQQYSALFSILGTQYGGNGTTTFQLPNLQAAVPLGTGSSPGSGTNYTTGQIGGSATVTLSQQQMPVHNHLFFGATGSSADLGQNNPANNTQISNLLSKASPSAPTGTYGNAYTPQTNPQTPPLASLNPQTIAVAGSSKAHDNMMPYVGTNYCICIEGIYPSRN